MGHNFQTFEVVFHIDSLEVRSFFGYDEEEFGIDATFAFLTLAFVLTIFLLL